MINSRNYLAICLNDLIKYDSTLENKAEKSDVDMLKNVIDAYAANLDNYATEMAAMQHKN